VEKANTHFYAVAAYFFFSSLPTYLAEIWSKIPFSKAIWAKVS
jgi:hypothetical protein